MCVSTPCFPWKKVLRYDQFLSERSLIESTYTGPLCGAHRTMFTEPSLRYFLLGTLGMLLVTFTLAGCAASEETASPSVPAAVGVWEYQAEAEQETYRGTITITQSETGELQGNISADDASAGSPELRSVSYEDSTLTLDIQGQSTGSMTATVEVENDRFEGEISVPRYGMTFPISAKKQRE